MLDELCDRTETFALDNEQELFGPESEEDMVMTNRKIKEWNGLIESKQKVTPSMQKDYDKSVSIVESFGAIVKDYIKTLPESHRIHTYMDRIQKLSEMMMHTINDPSEEINAEKQIRLMVFADQVISPLYQTVLRLLQNSTRVDNKCLYLQNSMGVFEHRVCENGMDPMHQIHESSTSKRKYEFRDLDFTAAAKTTCQAGQMDTGKIQLVLRCLRIWQDSSSLDEFYNTLSIRMTDQLIRPMTTRTLVNWTTKLVIQRYLYKHFSSQWDIDALRNVYEARTKGESTEYYVYEIVTPGVDSASILVRAQALRLIDTTMIPEPEESSRDLWAWLYWMRLKGSHMCIKFLKQLVLCGPKAFQERPVTFLSGGRMGKGEHHRAEDMTMHTLSQYLEQLSVNPLQSVQQLQSPDANQYGVQQIQSFLNRIGVRQRSTKRMDEHISRNNVRADMRRFIQWVQRVEQFGDHVDAVWMDETTISPHAVQLSAWGLQGDTSPAFGSKYTGGIYNMMLSMGCIGKHTFIHYMIYKPQRKSISIVGKTIVGTGSRVKTYGVFASVLNYLFNQWGENMLDPVEAPDSPWHLQEVVLQQQNLDPLVDFIAGMRQRYGCQENKLLFMWDSFSAHFAQMIKEPSNDQPMHRASYNHGGDMLREMFEVKGVRNMQMILLPRHTSQFNPCERVFALMKQYMRRVGATRNTDSGVMSEDQMYTCIHEFITKMKDSTLARLIYACKYNIQNWQPHERIHQDHQIDCNNPSTTVHGERSQKHQVVCASAANGLISRYLAPGSKRWHILSPLSVLFDKQQQYSIPTFTSAFWESFGNISDDLKDHFYTYAGYGIKEYLTLDDTAERQFQAAQERIKWIRKHIYDSEPTTEVMRIPTSYWLLALVLMGLSNKWVLTPGVFELLQKTNQRNKKFIRRYVMLYTKYTSLDRTQKPSMYAIVSTTSNKTANINYMYGRLTPHLTNFPQSCAHLSRIQTSGISLIPMSITLIPGSFTGDQLEQSSLTDLANMFCGKQKTTDLRKTRADPVATSLPPQKPEVVSSRTLRKRRRISYQDSDTD